MDRERRGERYRSLQEASAIEAQPLRAEKEEHS
jgi:hypothetical protein